MGSMIVYRGNKVVDEEKLARKNELLLLNIHEVITIGLQYGCCNEYLIRYNVLQLSRNIIVFRFMIQSMSANFFSCLWVHKPRPAFHPRIRRAFPLSVGVGLSLGIICLYST